jgi:hypothetical protein
MFSMLELVKIGCVFGKLGVQNTLHPWLANALHPGFLDVKNNKATNLNMLKELLFCGDIFP